MERKADIVGLNNVLATHFAPLALEEPASASRRRRRCTVRIIVLPEKTLAAGAFGRRRDECAVARARLAHARKLMPVRRRR
jgi:hypothetical protein